MQKGRPTKDNLHKCKIQIYITEDVEAELSRIAKDGFRSRPSVINEAIALYLNANKTTTSDIA